MNKQEAINSLPSSEDVHKDLSAAAAAWQNVPDEVKFELIKDGSVSVDHTSLAGQTVVYLSAAAETTKIVSKASTEKDKEEK